MTHGKLDTAPVLPAPQTTTKAGPRRPSWKAQKRRFTALVWLTRGIVVAALLTSWQVASGRWLNPFFFSSPSAIADRLWEWVSTGELWPHLLTTFQEMAVGFVVGTAGGIALGVLFGSIRFIARVFDPFVIALYSLPKIAIAPLLVLWFGLDMMPKIVLSALIVFFLVFFNTLTGVRAVDRELVDVLRVMGASRPQILRTVTLPSALTFIFVGLKVSVPYALVGAVTGELIASSVGLGSLIQKSASYFDTGGVFAALIILIIISTSLDRVLEAIERRWMRWQRSGRTDPRI